MPRDPLLPDSTSSVRPHSPDAIGGSERKRRRKVLSCYDCRRRKLQCDRAMPACGRCTKAGQAASCLYLDDPAETPTRNLDAAVQLNGETTKRAVSPPFNRSAQTAAPAGDLISRLEYQDRRIKDLESALSQAGPAQTQHLRSQRLPLIPDSITGLETAGATVNATDRETMLLRGKSFKTQFHGISHPGSLLAYIPDLGMFTKETFERFPALARMRQEFKVLDDRTDFNGPKNQVVTDADLTALLPSKQQSDELVQLYIDNYDSIYHTIHLPSFWTEYRELWSQPSAARAHFVALLLLMTAIAQCLRATEPWLYNANSSLARQVALDTIQACDCWLRNQSQKHVTDIDFQIRFMLNLARLVNASKFKRTWTDAGDFLRFCMAAGQHRNPELLRKKTSAMDKEMRRRIWFAAAEFELQASFGRGMISAPWLQQSDYVGPMNLQDDEFDQETQQLPASKPLHDFTSTSYLSMANETFALRYTLNTVLNNVRQTISFDEVKRYTEEIEMHLRAAPTWTEKGTEVPQALFSITLRQYLLVMHDRQVRQSTSSSEQNFSKMIIIDAAKKIVDSHKSLLGKGFRALQFLCHDQMRAVLSVFHVLSMPDPHADSILNDIVNQTSTKLVKDTIDLMTDKIYRLGNEQRQLWMVLAANAFVEAKKDPDQKLAYMQEAVDKVVQPFYKIMAYQEDAPSAVSSGPPTGRADLPNGVIEYLPTNGQVKSGENTTDPTLLDFDAMAAWTFDDWSFNAAEFASFNDPYQPLNP